ncbi:MAG: four helix bundle protein [Muribaculaceae bacterium]|nr:four helix bundle protein [Muribaculaceae bacterium]
MAYGSLCEIMNQLIIAFDLEFISEQQLSQFREEITTVAKLLSGMSTATQKRIQS